MAIAAAFLATGCVSVRELFGLPPEPTPTVAARRAETQWVLIKNPRFGDVASEPEYIWVEETKIPWSFTRFVYGTSALIAPPEIVEKYGRPPGGGKISPLQGGPYASAASPTQAAARPAPRSDAASRAAAGAGVESPAGRGYVIFVDTNRVVIDLTAEDGLAPGSVVSLRRAEVPIVHPVTGEVLGKLDMEVATAKVVEVREHFSVAEIQSVAPGSQVRVKDRVVPREPGGAAGGAPSPRP